MSTTPSPSERTSAVGQFFLGKGLPWTAAIESGLAEFEVKCVEHLKLLEDDEWDGLFIGCSVIIQRLASKVFAAVKESGDVDPNKCAQEMGIRANTITPASSQKRTWSSSNTAHKLKNDGSHKTMKSFFAVEKSVTKEDAKRQRLARKAEIEAEGRALAGLDGDVEVDRPPTADGAEDGADDGANDDSTGELDVDEELDADGDELMEIDDDNVEVVPAQHRAPVPTNWRAGRCALAQVLRDPAGEDEELAFDMDLLPEARRVDDFEDPLQYYDVLGADKTTSDEGIRGLFDGIKKKFRRIALKGHPDKHPSAKDRARYDKYAAKYERAQRAIEVLGTPDENGAYAERVAYDRRGEELRTELKEAVRVVYNCTVQDRAAQIRQRLKRDKIYEKRAENAVLHAGMSTLAKISKQWDRSGKQQAVSTHVLCAKAFDAGYSNAEIALEIRRYAFRREHFDETKKSKDKKYVAVIKTIGRYRGEHERGVLLPLLELKGKARAKAMKAKSVGKTGRGRKTSNEMSKTEKDLAEWVAKLNTDEKRVTTTMMFRKVMEFDPKFLGGVGSEGHLQRLKKWFYYGFAKRANLSVRKLASVGQKLPPDWPARMENLRGRVRARQNPQRQGDGSVRLEGVRDKHYVNTDHVPVWIESVGATSWGPKDSGRRTVKTGGKEKNRFTVQLSITKGGDKLIPFLIFKGAPVPKPGQKGYKAGKKCGGRNTLTYEFRHRTPDADGNPFPTREECYITCTELANSNRDLTNLILKKVILPGCGATSSDSEKKLADTSDHDIGVLWDDFKSHSTPEVKDFCLSRDFLKVDVMAGGLTPKGQPLDVVINKVFKAYFRDYYDTYALTAPLNDAGGPKPPTRQLLATWVVKSWEKVPRELVKKAWTACGYPSEDELGDPNVAAIVPYSPAQISGLVEQICDEDIRGAFDRIELDNDPFFPEDDGDEAADEEGDVGEA